MEYPKVLVISNNSFSKTSNNGRTLGNLFIGWPKDRIAQFCVSTTTPDYEVCDNYYLLTDKSAFDGFKHFRKGRRCDIEANLGTEGNTVIAGKKAFKTPWKALFRHIVWGCKRWDGKELRDWIGTFNPEIILVMNSDAPFILDIATDISKTRNIPLVMFNTEGYYFFKENYYHPSKCFSNTIFRFYQSIYKRHFRKMMCRVCLSIHLNSLLKDDFRNEFGGNHMVIYTGSSVEFDSSNLNVKQPVFSYLGNFGYNRPKALVEVAETLQSINTEYYLDVYGKAPREEVIELFNATKGIRFHGMIPYDEVIKVMKNSIVLFHVEAQDECFKESLRYGFSTKIADSISSGRCFVIYSSPDVAGAKYIRETGAGWFADNKNDLKQVIIAILTDADNRDEVLTKAKRIAIENHNVNTNCDIFKQTLLSIL